MEEIERGETPDQGLGLIGNRVLEQTLKFDLGSAFCWVRMVNMRRGVTMAVHREQ